MTRPGSIRDERTLHGLEHAVEEHRLDPHVVVEVLEVTKAVDSAECVRRELRCAVTRDIEPVRACEAVHPQQPGDTAAARDVRLQAVDAADQVPEIGGDVGVLARGDIEQRLFAYET